MSKKIRNLLGAENNYGTKYCLNTYCLLAGCWLRTFRPGFSIAVGQIIKQPEEINQVKSESNCSMWLRNFGNWFYFGSLARGGVGFFPLCSWFLPFFFLLLLWLVLFDKLTQFQLYRARSATFSFPRSTISPLSFLSAPLSPPPSPTVCLLLPAALYAKFVCFLCKFPQTTRETTAAESTKTLLLGEFLLSALSVLQVPRCTPFWTHPPPPAPRPSILHSTWIAVALSRLHWKKRR